MFNFGLYWLREEAIMKKIYIIKKNYALCIFSWVIKKLQTLRKQNIALCFFLTLDVT